MQSNSKTQWLLLLMTMVVVIGGCTTPALQAEKMIPSLPHRQARVSDSTLRVKEVTGGTKLPAICCTYSEVKIDNETLQDALVRSLIVSGLFTNVTTFGNSEYDLVVEIAGQENTMVGVLTYQTNLLINYDLIDRRTNEKVLREHIFSQRTEEGSWGDALQALLKMNELAVMENLSQFITKLTSFVDSRQNSEKVKP